MTFRLAAPHRVSENYSTLYKFHKHIVYTPEQSTL
jgi:hypothetical protein